MLPRPNSSIIYQAMPDGAVLFAPSTELYFALNEAGACIWENLPPKHDSIEDLCGAVLQRFPDADPAQVSTDVRQLLAVLGENGLVEASP
jgi:hypothetical protein